MGPFILLAIVILCKYSEGGMSPLICDPYSYPCADNSKCVQIKNLCDHHKDCDDFSDEEFSMCRKFHEKRGSCSTGTFQDQRHGYGGECRHIAAICDPGNALQGQFLSICNQIKNGLKPMVDFTEKNEEISTLREKLTALKDESKLKDIFEHLASSFNESSCSKNDSDCPPLYVNIGGKCVAFFTVAKVTWAEAKQFCESISGQLAILRRIKDYEPLLKHLKSQNFWIGGHCTTQGSSNSSSWTWLDNNEIASGAPFWSLYQTPNCTTRGTSPVCYPYSLAPRENRAGFCLALDYAFHYYFIDQNCLERRSPICFHKER